MSDNPTNIVKIGSGSSVDNPSSAVPVGQLSNILHFVISSTSAPNNGFYGLYKTNSPVAQAQYQVTAAKTLRVIGAYIWSSTASCAVTFGYGTAAIASESTTTAPTGVIYYGGGGTTSPSAVTGAAGSTVPIPNIIGMTFPSASYPFVRWISTAGTPFVINLICIET